MHTESYELDIRHAALLLDSLCIYRNLLKDPVLEAYHRLLRQVAQEAPADSLTGLYADFFNRLASNSDTISLMAYTLDKVITDENPFTLSVSKAVSGPSDGVIPGSVALLADAAAIDLSALQASASLPPRMIKSHIASASGLSGIKNHPAHNLPEWDCRQENNLIMGTSPADDLKRLLLTDGNWGGRTEDLIRFHRENGTGVFAQYYAFNWLPDTPEGFVPISAPDPVRLSDLIAYESEREEVVKNTEQFLAGFPANNVLLYGDRGTGKSSTVKALLNEYRHKGLRMIEVPKSRLVDFPAIVRRLAGRNRKFIIFVDDLAFEDNEENYTALKAILEGGLEVRPANVLIYATSNRRHLIKEKFSDRAGLQYGTNDDEIRAADSIQEKLSLSDRFGITVVFSSPDKNRYLDIIDELAQRRCLRIDRETLHREAMKWELWYNGRSPRTACQFINWLEGNLKS